MVRTIVTKQKGGRHFRSYVVFHYESFKSQKKPIEESDMTIQKQELVTQIKSRGVGKPY